MTERVRVTVQGRVQGVYFRAATRDIALSLGLDGWVRNTAEGDVEAVFEGTAESVAQAVEWCRRGPERAVVTDLNVTAEQPEGLSGFEIRH